MSNVEREHDPRCLNLAHFRELERGWDTYDGLPIAGQAIRTAENLTAVPCSDGGIQLELHAGGADIEIEIDSTGKVTSILLGGVGG